MKLAKIDKDGVLDHYHQDLARVISMSLKNATGKTLVKSLELINASKCLAVDADKIRDEMPNVPHNLPRIVLYSPQSVTQPNKPYYSLIV